MRIPLDFAILLKTVKLDGPSGSPELDLLLDTGAYTTILSRRIVELAGYDWASSTRFTQLVTANGTVKVPILEVEALKIQEIIVRKLDVCIHDIPEAAHIEGLLGLNFLRHFRTVIDYPNRFLEIT